MKRIIFAVMFLALPCLSFGAGGEGYPLKSAPIDPHDKASLQRGAKLFVNYCMGCHSLEHQRYNRMGRDIGLTDEQVKENLIFTGAKVGDTMKNAMPKADAKRWFGVTPPDLTLIARSRGVDYLYTYLQTFYQDPSRPFGVNNAVFPNAGMPHVLWQLQGMQKPIYEVHKDASGHETKVLKDFELVQPGSMSPPEFKEAMADLTNFLAYAGEPIKLERQKIGIWVLLFLVLAFGVFYLLKKEYWKDVH
ncbi:MAG TPA: cytochrome c1 [Candidatus Competibacteraceae bacterium]|nr:MAG: cytochrome c1 [Candidatus Competibacteraceae bacterium]HOB60552.1 cytochrome c1 [Candidatus Competibacteraceae bacterium]HQA24674.1 cytochrome c1 [Candidatus Competibacteraceae bacterium]HQD54923.1 cytochrome c1 [Candidatus Competibacteraceae bacterium]